MGNRGVAVEECEQANAEHNASQRQYAHVFHRAGVVCVADAFYDLPDQYQLGIMLHEMGHLLNEGIEHTEGDANQVAFNAFGIPIEYRDSAYGKQVEWIAPQYVARAKEIVMGKHNPAVSAKQYHMLQAAASGQSYASKISPSAAEEMIRKTPKHLRELWSRQNPEKSKGHLMFRTDDTGTWEFFQAGDMIYRAQLKYASGTDSGSYIDIYGVRPDARQFAPMWQWDMFKSKGMYPFDKHNNPGNTAAELSEGFHGRPPEETIDIVEHARYSARQAVVGVLEELDILDGDVHMITISFKHGDHRSAFARSGKDSDAVYVTFPNRNQLEFVGGDQSLPVKGKTLEDVGPVYGISYWTDKHHLEGERGFGTYHHWFGEESVRFNREKPSREHLEQVLGYLPMLVYDTVNAKCLLVGGSYTVEDEGIRN